MRKGLDKAVENAGILRPRWHDLRHTYASLLIAAGLDPVYVSRQIGHSSPAITLSVYAHLFDRERSAERAKAALEASFVANAAQATPEPVAEVVPLAAVAV